jgi:hypothetical protein
MANISLQINDSEVRRMLAQTPAALERAMRGAMNDATALLLRELQTYPTQRTGRSYVRTGTLRRSWSRDIDGQGLAMRGIVGSNENMAPYNRLVQDADRQAPIHHGLWTNTIQNVVSRNETAIQDMFEARFRAELEG